jgi:hypothetical protein
MITYEALVRRPGEFLFIGRYGSPRSITTRQYARLAPARQVQTTVPLKHSGLESEFQTSDKQLGSRFLLIQVATTSRQLAYPRPALLKRRQAIKRKHHLAKAPLASAGNRSLNLQTI